LVLSNFRLKAFYLFIAVVDLVLKVSSGVSLSGLNAKPAKQEQD
jgi:hypothetical protein